MSEGTKGSENAAVFSVFGFWIERFGLSGGARSGMGSLSSSFAAFRATQVYVLRARGGLPIIAGRSKIGSAMMTEAAIARKEPYEVALEAGRNYAWCACGRSANQPWCDGSHSGSGLKPVVWKAEQDETAWLCGCKRTGDEPRCDGTHNGL